MTVGEVVKLFERGQHYQLIGGRTGKKLANSWNTKKYAEKFNNFLVIEEGCIFSSFRPIDDKITRTPDFICPIICIWVSGL